MRCICIAGWTCIWKVLQWADTDAAAGRLGLVHSQASKLSNGRVWIHFPHLLAGSVELRLWRFSLLFSYVAVCKMCFTQFVNSFLSFSKKKHFFEWTKLCLLQARLQLQLQCLHYRALQLLLAGCCSCSNSQHSRTLKCELNCTATAPASSWILVHQPCDLFVSFWCWQARKHSHHKE